jgi:hypothetical protein
MTNKPSWSEIRPTLQNLDSKALIALIKDLHALSQENRDFLAARLAAGARNQSSREAYRQRIEEIFFPKRGFPVKLDLRAGRKAINEYKKATGDIEGTVDLMLTYVESGTEFSRQYGDIDMPFYNSLVSVLEAISEELRKHPQGPEIYRFYQSRFLELERNAGGMGWGYGDFVIDTIGQLDADYTAED